MDTLKKLLKGISWLGKVLIRVRTHDSTEGGTGSTPGWKPSHVAKKTLLNNISGKYCLSLSSALSLSI